jgi:hypothetical protein
MPKIENTPGIAWRKNQYGHEARWRARADLIRRGFEPLSVKLWAATHEQPEPDEFDVAFMQDRCNALQSEMLAFAHGGLPAAEFDGTLASLIRCYQTDPDSAYREIRYKSRGHYDTLLRMIGRDWPGATLEKIDLRSVKRWYESYRGQGKIAMGHSLVRMLRTVISFGARLLELEQCLRLQNVLKDKFKMPKPRSLRLTADMAEAIIAEAHKQGLPMVAFAQALQFEMMIRQKDVIGEWIPISEPGLSAVTNGNEKWLRGLDWKEVDANFVVTHVTSKRQKPITVDLRLAPMVIRELQGIARNQYPATGPMVVDKRSGLPYTDAYFRRTWRKIADVVGVPREVKNMDTRAGAISEATDAGAPLEQVRKAATHSDISMTQRYSRGDTESIAVVQRLRVAHRTKTDDTQ